MIKWPNDVLINDKKVSGILLESVMSTKLEALIVGIGINVNNGIFPDNLNSKATSLKLETRDNYDMEILIDEILKWFDYYYNDFLKNHHSYLKICRKYSSVIGNSYLINGKSAYVLDILDNGNILVKHGNDNIEYSYGELTLEDSYWKGIVLNKAGILLHISSLSGEYGIGTMGRKAYDFVDFLEASGQSYWQMLPLGPNIAGNSPYLSTSMYAGNPLLNDFNVLFDDG